jgi:GNAT superfamily N-acetyltransferase
MIRPARPDDAPLVLAMIRELADYERLAHAVDATEDMIAEALFGPQPRVFCEIAEHARQGVGFALWFYSFSTFRGRHGIHVEDLYVRSDHRGRGLGKALLAHLARRCVTEDLARLEWSVLDWNAPSIAFYRSLGAEALDEWTGFRLSEAPLWRLADQAR